MKMKFALSSLCLLIVSLLALGGCGSGGSGSPEGCEEGATLACTCADGASGAQVCSGGVWGTCECQSTGCQEGETQDCLCDDGSSGSQTCSGGVWGACQCTPPECQDGQTQGCLCNDGSPGQQTCLGGSWGNCQCDAPECQDGQVQDCTCADGSPGQQSCLGGSWGNCECLSNDCQNGTTQDCVCADGSAGSQTCVNGSWGDCDCATRCTDGQTQACTCADGSSGEQLCQGGVWGNCECGSGGLADLAGTFASISHMSTISEAPVVGEVNSTTVAYALVQVTQNGNDVTTNAVVCGIEMDSGSALINMTVPQAFIDSLDPVVGHGQLQDNGGSVGIVTDEMADVRGWQPNDPWEDELPTEPDDPRVYDQDNDGNPGLTVMVEGFVDCETYVVMRDISSSVGEVLSDDRVESLVTFESEMYLVDATNDLCMMQNGNPTWQDPVAENSYSILQRIDPGWTCAEVMANKDTLFQ